MKFIELMEVVVGDVGLLLIYLEEASRKNSNLIIVDWEDELTEEINFNMGIWADETP